MLNHTVAEIHGDKRVEGVTITAVDNSWNPIAGTEQFVECDTLLLSVGLIPENELSKMAGVEMDPQTGGACVNELLETNIEGIFACGNVLHVNDIADAVSDEGEFAAFGAHDRIRGKSAGPTYISVKGDGSIAQVVPQRVSGQQDTIISVRVKKPMNAMTLRVGEIFKKKFPYARPSEMIWVKLSCKIFAELGAGVKELRVSCEER